MGTLGISIHLRVILKREERTQLIKRYRQLFRDILVQSNKAVLGQTQGTSTKQKSLRFVAGHLPKKQTVAALLQLRAPL